MNDTFIPVGTIEIKKGSIIYLKTDAIVNAANNTLRI